MLTDCYFCDEPFPECFIDNFNNIMICFGCNEFNIFYKKSINIINNIDECPVCFENKKGIELPNCNHIICIDCCKSIYYGYNNNPRPKHYKECIEPEFPYDIHDDDGEQKWDEYYNWYEDSLEELEQLYSLEHILNTRNNLTQSRPEWMNSELFIDYENKYVQYQKERIKCENEFDNWEENKKSNIKNASCPLCRK